MRDPRYRRMGYEPSLDGIRGLGAIFAVIVHLFMVTIPLHDQLPEYVSGAFVFMDMFFVLSGFLITALLLKEQTDTGRTDVLQFYKRRALRLLPALWFLLACYALYGAFSGYGSLGGAKLVRTTILFCLAYGLNYHMTSITKPEVSAGLSHLWSLGLEEQFYLFWPLIVIVLIPLRRRLWISLTLLGAGITFVAVRRYVLFVNGDLNWFAIYIRSDTRADSLLVGAFMAYLWVHKKRLPDIISKIAGWAGVATITLYIIYGRQDQPFAPEGGYTLTAIMFSFVMVASIDTDWLFGRLLKSRPMVAVGRVSYSLYLWHYPVQVEVARYGPTWGAPLRVVVALAVTAVVTLVSYNFVEKPFLNLKNRGKERVRASLTSSYSGVT